METHLKVHKNLQNHEKKLWETEDVRILNTTRGECNGSGIDSRQSPCVPTYTYADNHLKQYKKARNTYLATNSFAQSEVTLTSIERSGKRWSPFD